MNTFKSTEDHAKLSLDDPIFPIVEDLVKCLITDYISEDDGWICTIEPHDKDRALTESWPDWTLLDIPWKGITQREVYFLALFLANNLFGIEFVIPDAPWVNGERRKMIEDNLDPSPIDTQEKTL